LNGGRRYDITESQGRERSLKLMEIGRRIAAARTAAGLTQQELADKLFVSRHLVSKWELGLRRPDLETAKLIASALSVPPDSIVSREECVISELQSIIPKGADIPPERLSGLISGFLREQGELDADIFIQKYYLLHPYPDIALDHGMRENQIRSRLSRTVRRLGKYLKEECENDRH
jgi:transcriptional regulator with XRE-family HTH domain